MADTRNIDAVNGFGVDSYGIRADAFYSDLMLELGEAPGQMEAFDRLLDCIPEGATAEAWHLAMLGFGLGRAFDDESMAFVIEAAAAAFSMVQGAGTCSDSCGELATAEQSRCRRASTLGGVGDE